jgi:hypothetical protein
MGSSTGGGGFGVVGVFPLDVTDSKDENNR